MSIKISTGTTAASVKDLSDLKVGISGNSSKDVNKVLKWDGTVLWERVTTKVLSATNTSFTIDPDPYVESGTGGYWDLPSTGVKPSIKHPTTGMVDRIRFTEGGVSYTLVRGTHFNVSFKNNTGRLPSSGTIEEGKSAEMTGYVVIEGIPSGGYSGKFDTEFTIKYTRTASKTTYYLTAMMSPNTVDEGSITGAGSVESTGSYGDFTLQWTGNGTYWTPKSWSSVNCTIESTQPSVAFVKSSAKKSGEAFATLEFIKAIQPSFQASGSNTFPTRTFTNNETGKSFTSYYGTTSTPGYLRVKVGREETIVGGAYIAYSDMGTYGFSAIIEDEGQFYTYGSYTRCHRYTVKLTSDGTQYGNVPITTISYPYVTCPYIVMG